MKEYMLDAYFNVIPAKANVEKVLRELKSRCMQVSNNYEKLAEVFTVDYLSLCK